MKKVLVAAFIMSSISGFAQNKNQREILHKYITANNTGTDEAFHQFIKETYAPGIYEKIIIADHINFYKQIEHDFGDLKFEVYEKVDETPIRLVVYLIKENANILDRTIDPSQVLVLEMDLLAQNPAYLSRGLGLGALICEKEKDH